jgi:hypothetical protein
LALEAIGVAILTVGGFDEVAAVAGEGGIEVEREGWSPFNQTITLQAEG